MFKHNMSMNGPGIDHAQIPPVGYLSGYQGELNIRVVAHATGCLVQFIVLSVRTVSYFPKNRISRRPFCHAIKKLIAYCL